VRGIQSKYKTVVDSLPLENPQVLKAKLVGLRNKASMEGDHHGGALHVESS
jgi:hypothetical protein